MKEETTKIIQMCVEPCTYYTSNGSPYKDTTNTYKVYGLGDDGKVYSYGEHKFWHDDTYQNQTIIGWKLYIPN